jgi:hypothetical protein
MIGARRAVRAYLHLLKPESRQLQWVTAELNSVAGMATKRGDERAKVVSWRAHYLFQARETGGGAHWPDYRSTGVVTTAMESYSFEKTFLRLKLIDSII